MPEALELGHKEWELKKRRNHDLITNNSNNNSVPTDEWESSSTTAPKVKRAKSQSDWRTGGNEEVGDSDDLQLVGREIFDTTGIGIDNGMMGSIGLDEHKEGVIEIQGTKPVRPHQTIKETKMNGTCSRDVAKGMEGEDEKTRQDEPLTTSGTRLRMQSIMLELKKAREDMLLWLRREMHNLFYEGSSGGRRMSIGGGGPGGVEMEYEEQQGSEHNGISGTTPLGNGSGGMDFGAQGSGSGGTEFFAGQTNSPGVGGGGIAYNVQNGGDSNYGTQNGVSGREDSLGRLNECSDGTGVRFAGHNQKSGSQADIGFGVRDNNNGNGGMNFGMQSRGHDGGVAMNLHNGSVQILGYERQNGTGNGILSFRSQHPVPSEMTFGAPQQSGSGGMNYASQTVRETGMVFGGQNIENGTGIQDGGRGGAMIKNGSSTVMGRSNTSANSAGNLKVNSTHISDEERTPDLIGMQNQNLQNPVALSMMWNNVAQTPRGLNQNISDSSVHGFNYDTHAKLGNGTLGTYRGLVHGGTTYENNIGMMNSTVMHAANPTQGMQLPMRLQTTAANNLNTSSLPSLMGMQSQLPMQSFSGMQNFLGLSMNGNMGPTPVEGMGQQVFSYLNERPQHPANAKSNPLSASGAVRSRSHKRSGTLLGADILELNS
ncbi:hypothetical protein KI387_035345 [Taxus chinensis]|uniref:Uncharacterized protein n=1 Tax=Taxus chinensis TaxID=29808 RepID=A0AA38FN58_TAXCH|nr:hypothetical protein KI387_035345 [Taxus chinensis]